MKQTFFLLYLILSLGLNATAHELCDPRLQEHRESSRAIAFLQSIQGDYEGDTCSLSLRVCAGYATQSKSSGAAYVGELLLVHKSTGQEFYLPIDFFRETSRRTRFSLEQGRRMFHYELYDHNKDPVGGSLAVFLFEAVKTMDLAHLEYVEFGLRRPADSRLNWAVCRVNLAR